MPVSHSPCVSTERYLLAGHVEVQVRVHALARRLVVRGDCLATKQATFLTRVEVELEIARGLEPSSDEDTEHIHEVHGSGTIVVSAWGTARGGRVEVDAVLVGSENDSGSGGGCAGDLGNDRLLGPGVRELGDSYTSLA